jgi:hypothetical protein
VQVPAAGGEVAKVLPAFAVERHDLAVEDRLLNRQFLADPIAELLESFEDVPTLRPKVAALRCDVEQAAVAVVFWLEYPGGIIERFPPQGKEDRLNKGKGPAGSWAHAGSWAAYELPFALPTMRTAGLTDLLPIGA